MNNQVIDQAGRHLVLGRMKKQMETITCLSFRYTGLEEYRSALAAEIAAVKPLKRKKRFSFLNPENLLQV